MRLSRIAALCAVGEPSGDRRAGQMHDGVDAGQQIGCRPVRIPLPLSSSPCAGRRTSRITRCPPVLRNADSAEPTRPDAPVTATTSGFAPARRRRDVRPDRRRAAGAGRRTSSAAPPRAPWCRRGRTPLCRRRRLAELVGVPPPADDPCGPRRRALRGQLVDEPVRRVEAGRIVLRDPAQAAGQAQHRAPVGQRRRLRQHLHRLPRRHQPRHRARAGYATRTPRPADGRRRFRTRCPCPSVISSNMDIRCRRANGLLPGGVGTQRERYRCQNKPAVVRWKCPRYRK